MSFWQRWTTGLPVYVTRKDADGLTGTFSMPGWAIIPIMLLAQANVVGWSVYGLVYLGGAGLLSLVEGQRVRVLDEYDIPAMFRGGKPTEGVVDHVLSAGEGVSVRVPIGNDDPEVHSQSVFYDEYMLEVID